MYIKLPDWISKVHRKYLQSQKQFSLLQFLTFLNALQNSRWEHLFFQSLKDHFMSPNPHGSVRLVINISHGLLSIFVKQFLIAIFFSSLNSSLSNEMKILQNYFFFCIENFKWKLWQCPEQAFEFLFLQYVTLAFWKCQLSFGSSLNHHHYIHCLRMEAGHKFLFISPLLDLVLFTIEFNKYLWIFKKFIF